MHVYTVTETAAAARVTRPHIYNMLKRNELESFKVGGAIRIPRKAVAALIGEEQLDAFEAGRHASA